MQDFIAKLPIDVEGVLFCLIHGLFLDAAGHGASTISFSTSQGQS